MNHGFLIDTRSCIGCHACSTACKSENQVPIGVSRTWVKYTEVGTYPDVKRNFQVTRCNHCSNPPCVRICPVTAMYQRTDGIVEFDSDVCIGCKGCMQACPYDAVYIDPETQTAAKRHFCSHRIEVAHRLHEDLIHCDNRHARRHHRFARHPALRIDGEHRVEDGI
jgi:Fe-S-cluster-containing dehydrogenase component